MNLWAKKSDFSRRSVEEYSNMKFHENPSSGSLVFHTNRQTRRN